MREHVVPANLVTSVSLAAGVLALLLDASQVALAAALVVLAGVLDVVDGALARRRGGDHVFGAQLDSLTDLLCFCIVPAVVLHRSAGGAAPVLGRAVAVAFVVAGAWRLARFPLVQRQGSFVGLPTPAAGGLVMLLVLWAPAAVALVGAVVLAGLMVSTVRVPSLLATVAARPRHRDADRPGRSRVLRSTRARVVARTRRVRPRLARPRPRRAAQRAGRLLSALRHRRR